MAPSSGGGSARTPQRRPRPGRRRLRGERCALPRRADGPPEHGYPYRTHSWLHTARRQPHLAHYASLVPDGDPSVSPPPPPVARRLLQRTAFPWLNSRAGDEVLHGGALMASGVPVPLPINSTEATLAALAVRHRDLSTRPMLRVKLSDARKLLGCVSDHARSQALLHQLFQMRWCWRPEEMTEPRKDPISGAEIDVCVWGVSTPTAPPSCASGPLSVPPPRVDSHGIREPVYR